MATKSKNVFFITLAVLILFICVFPFLYMILQSFAPWDQVDKVFIPRGFTLRSYDFLFNTGSQLPWLRALFNSAFVSFSTATIAIVVAMFLAYAVVKIKFRGYKLIDNVILIQLFFPVIIILVPLYIITRGLGLDNTYAGMILPKALNAWAIFMYINYFRGIPEEMLEAARIDGASELKTMLRIVLPTVKSITVILFLFIFMERWNELLWDSIVITTNENLKTLNVLISSVSGPYGSYPGALYAASVILTVPIVLLFIAFSKQVYKGMSYVSK